VAEGDRERELEEARRELDRRGAALRGRHTGDEVGDYRRAYDRLLEAERALADARAEEHAVPCEGFPAWDAGAPLPHLVSDGGRATLLYLGRDEDRVVVVRFHRVASVRMGAPNDEVLDGHPLHGKGLRAYAAHTVARSSWTEELQRINAVHRAYDPARWTRYHHYLLTFHDETFECVAEGFTAATTRASLAEACREALDALLT